MEPMTVALLSGTATALTYFFIDLAIKKHHDHQEAKQKAAADLWLIRNSAERAEEAAIKAAQDITLINLKLKELENEK